MLDLSDQRLPGILSRLGQAGLQRGQDALVVGIWCGSGDAGLKAVVHILDQDRRQRRRLVHPAQERQLDDGGEVVSVLQRPPHGGTGPGVQDDLAAGMQGHERGGFDDVFKCASTDGAILARPKMAPKSSSTRISDPDRFSARAKLMIDSTVYVSAD